MVSEWELTLEAVLCLTFSLLVSAPLNALLVSTSRPWETIGSAHVPLRNESPVVSRTERGLPLAVIANTMNASRKSGAENCIVRIEALTVECVGSGEPEDSSLFLLTVLYPLCLPAHQRYFRG